MHDYLLPDALAKALGLVVADVQAEFKKELERMEAERRAILAETKAENAALRVELKEQAAAYEARIAEALAKVKDGEPGRDGKDGENGTSVTVADVAPLIERQVSDAVAAIHVPKDGVDGRDGKDADPEEVKRMVAEAVAAIPAPQNGKDADEAGIEARLTEKLLQAIPEAKEGPPGRDADPVAPEAIAEAVADYMAANPPADGKDADPHEIARLLLPEIDKAVAKIQPKDGRGIRAALIDRDGELVLTFDDGETQKVGAVVGKNGEDGKPGRDGFSPEDFEAELKEDGRTLVLRVVRDDIAFASEIVLPIVIDRGIFKQGEAYVRGDGVSYAGSFWIAQKDAPEGKPDDGSGGWRLAVKRGRDGRDKAPD
jgi:hypothetical protein